jgi:hypothetical protein
MIMSMVESPSHKPGDELDELLRAFFYRQMPNPWPPSRRPTTNGRGLIRSRWSLAASVAVLVAGSFLLPNPAPQQSKADNSLNGAPTISDDLFRRQMKREHNERQLHKNNKPDDPVEDEDHLPEMDDLTFPFIK